MADYSDLFGARYRRGARYGRDPGFLDCYGLLMEAYRRFHGRDLPDIATPESVEGICAIVNHKASTEWVQMRSRPGAVLLMRVGRCMHTGLQISDTEFIHMLEGGNVCIERIDRWSKRIVGFYSYKH